MEGSRASVRERGQKCIGIKYSVYCICSAAAHFVNSRLHSKLYRRKTCTALLLYKYYCHTRRHLHLHLSSTRHVSMPGIRAGRRRPRRDHPQHRHVSRPGFEGSGLLEDPPPRGGGRGFPVRQHGGDYHRRGSGRPNSEVTALVGEGGGPFFSSFLFSRRTCYW